MSLTNEDLIAISQLLDEKLDEKLNEKIIPRLDKLERVQDEVILENILPRLDRIEQSQCNMELLLENDIVPRLQNIEECYLSTYQNYKMKNSQMDEMKTDIEVLKKVVKEHSEKLEKIS